MAPEGILKDYICIPYYGQLYWLNIERIKRVRYDFACKATVIEFDVNDYLIVETPLSEVMCMIHEAKTRSIEAMLTDKEQQVREVAQRIVKRGDT